MVIFGFSGLLVITALAQNAVPAAQVSPGTAASISPQQGIGAAPANTPQHEMLNGALSPETRQALAEAMAEYPTADTTPSGAFEVGPGEVAELDGSHFSKIALTAAPASLQEALGSETQRSLLTGAGR